MIKTNNYWSGGMGLHSSQIEHLSAIILENNVKTIVEFGSGGSTQFLIDLREENNLKYRVYSFDHHPQYAYRGNHNFLNLHMRDLVQCNDEQFNEIFSQKRYDKSYFVNAQNEMNNFRAKNCFYDITDNDLPENIDLVILDGPNGNGRSLAFLHLQGRLSDTSFILIDDSDHYDFIARGQEVLGANILVHENDPDVHHNFSYAILQVNS